MEERRLQSDGVVLPRYSYLSENTVGTEPAIWRFTMIRTYLFVACALVATACGGKSASDTTPAGGSGGGDACGGDACGGDACAGGDACGGGDATPDFSGWDGWVKVSDARFLSKGHGKPWVEVYIEAGGVDNYNARTGPYAVGTKVVKVQYATEDATDIDRLTVMQKMAPGYDPDNGDWFYGVYSPDGGKGMKTGKIDMCINCHDQASESDYVFGKAE